MGAGGGPQRGLITVLRGPWKREGRSNGQPSLLVRHRSSAERRWVEAYRQTALGSVVCRRYFGCGVDNCRNVFSVGQPETMKLTQVGLKRLQNSGGSRRGRWRNTWPGPALSIETKSRRPSGLTVCRYGRKMIVLLVLFDGVSP